MTSISSLEVEKELAADEQDTKDLKEGVEEAYLNGSRSRFRGKKNDSSVNSFLSQGIRLVHFATIFEVIVYSIPVSIRIFNVPFVIYFKY